MLSTSGTVGNNKITLTLGETITISAEKVDNVGIKKVSFTFDSSVTHPAFRIDNMTTDAMGMYPNVEYENQEGVKIATFKAERTVRITGIFITTMNLGEDET